MLDPGGTMWSFDSSGCECERIISAFMTSRMPLRVARCRAHCGPCCSANGTGSARAGAGIISAGMSTVYQIRRRQHAPECRLTFPPAMLAGVPMGDCGNEIRPPEAASHHVHIEANQSGAESCLTCDDRRIDRGDRWRLRAVGSILVRQRTAGHPGSCACYQGYHHPPHRPGCGACRAAVLPAAGAVWCRERVC